MLSSQIRLEPGAAAGNRARDRRSHRDPGWIDDHSAGDADAPSIDAAERSVVCEHAAGALAAMTPPQRHAVIHVVMFGRSYTVAAAALGVPVGP
jgi:DNA-directed RNA polymerase specialized sigma24 family protein